MKPPTVLAHEFVEVIPDEIEERTIYISMDYATAVHRCCCGCAREVVTPLSPTDWTLTYDGVSISLNPSIGNWGFECRSHYWISKNEVQWASQWSRGRIEAGRAQDSRSKERYYAANETASRGSGGPFHTGLITRLWRRLREMRPR